MDLGTLDLGVLKFGYSEKATKFEKNFHLKFDVTYIYNVEDFFKFWVLPKKTKL